MLEFHADPLAFFLGNVPATPPRQVLKGKRMASVFRKPLQKYLPGVSLAHQSVAVANGSKQEGLSNPGIRRN